jgi:molybdenum cofactor cytidylyltransferase
MNRPQTEEGNVAAIVLAAGAASRFGGPKLLAPIDGMPIVRKTVVNTLAAGLEDVVVVVAPGAGEVRAALHGLPVRFAVNECHAEGIGASIRAGIGALNPGTAATFILLGDQPTVAPGILDRLVGAYERSGKPIVVPVYDGVRGNPVLFDASFFPELARSSGDRGARDLVERSPALVERVDFPFPPPLDVDTPEDYARLSGADRPASPTRRSRPGRRR